MAFESLLKFNNKLGVCKMPMGCSCSLCVNPMFDSAPGNYPPICHDCWVAYPDGGQWESPCGRRVAFLLDQEGIIKVSSWDSRG